MLTTGIRTPLGLKISGDDLQTIEDIGTQVEAALPAVRGTRNVFAERTGGGFFLDIEWNRDELARYGLSMDEAQSVVQSAIGGENVTTTVEGRERYPVNVRYMRDFRSDLDALGRVLVPASGGARQIPLGQLATIRVHRRAGHDPERGRPADRLRVRGRGRSGPGQLRAGSGPAHPQQGHAAAGLRGAVERPVRGDGSRARSADLHRPAHAVPRIPAALLQHPIADQDGDRRAGCPLLRHWCRLVPVLPRLQHEHRGVGGADRPDGSGCRDGRLHAALPGSLLQAGEEARGACGRWPPCRRPSCTALPGGCGRSS